MTGQSHTYGVGRYTVDIEQHFTDPPERGEWPITYQPNSTLHAMTLTVTDTETGAMCRFHGCHDELANRPLFEFMGGMPLVDIVEEANAIDRVRALHTPFDNDWDDESHCSHCCDGYGTAEPWPCATARALGIEP